MNKLKSTGKVLTILLMAIVIMISINPTVAQAQQAKDITIIIDDEQLKTDVAPVVQNNRTLVPFRAIFEGLGSRHINWYPETQSIEAIIDEKRIDLTVGSPIAEVDGVVHELDTVPIVKNGRTLVPIRFIAESTGYDVDWVQEDKLVKITRKYSKFYSEKENKGLNMGDSVNRIIKNFGQPARKDKSEYGFTWYIYNQDLSKYFQVGIEDGKVVAFGTNSVGWRYEDYKIGQVHEDLLGKSGHITGGTDTFIDIYSDIHESYRVSSILAMDDRLVLSERTYTPEVLEGMALQLYDLTNVYRVRSGRTALDMDDSLVKLAEYHANDMAVNGFFSHTSSDGRSLGDRARDLIGVRGLSENISLNSNVVGSASSLYNSKGHRDNMMSNHKAIGTAANYGNRYNIPLFVQNFKLR